MGGGVQAERQEPFIHVRLKGNLKGSFRPAAEVRGSGARWHPMLRVPCDLADFQGREYTRGGGGGH